MGVLISFDKPTQQMRTWAAPHAVEFRSMRNLRSQCIRPVALAVALYACGGSYGDAAAPTQPVSGPKLSSIDIDAPSSSITVNGSVQLAVSAVDQNGNSIAVALTWSSSNTAVAAVGASGLVTAVATGAAVITAIASTGGVTVSKTITINVMPQWVGAPPPTNVMVNDPSKGRVPDIAQAEPSIAVFGARIVVGWNDETIAFGQTLRGIKRGVDYGFSSDGGATFRDVGTVGGANWGADPSLAVDRAGNFYFGRMDLVPGSATLDRIAVFKSTDGGATFPQSSTASDESQINDKPTIAVDNSGTQFAGNVYASWTLASSNVLNIRFSRSTNGGASFSSPIQLSSGVNDQASIPVLGPGGELYVVWFEQFSGNLFVRKSTNGGVSFGTAILVATASHVGDLEGETAQYCGRVLKGSLRARSFPSIAVDRSGGSNNGTVYVAFSSHGVGADGADVYLTTSRDGGATWSTPSRLNDDATINDQWLPFVAVAPNGSVAVSWYDRRRDDQNLLIDVFMRISTTGGASFGPNLKITEVSFPPSGINRTLGFPPYTCYFSSYNFMAVDMSHFYVVWTDNRRVRSSTIDPNIFFAKVPY